MPVKASSRSARGRLMLVVVIDNYVFQLNFIKPVTQFFNGNIHGSWNVGESVFTC